MSPVRRLTSGIVLAVAFTIFTVTPALGQGDPNTSRGFSADNLYQFSEVDTIDLFNGNLTLLAPMGQEYPINAGFNYRLQLSYNSNVWEFHTESPDLQGQEPVTVAQPAEQFNAGLGWKLSLGELEVILGPTSSQNRYLYHGPDGATHRFYESLHTGESSVSGWYYTRDNTYLRLHLISGGATVEFPDGKIHTFNQDSPSSYRLSQIRDRHGNSLDVTYTNGGLTWNLADGHRTHQIYFVNKNSDGRTIAMVDRVVMKTFDNTTATYNFIYNNTFTTERHRQDSRSELDPDFLATTPVLTEIRLPDGSSWKMPTYGTTREVGPGMLSRLRLPTGGQVDYTYGDYVYPSRIRDPQGPGVDINVNHGVVKKRMLNLGGGCFQVGEVGCEWTYTPSDQTPTTDHRTTTVMHPNGDKVVHHFDQSWDQNGTAQTLWRYGLPIHPTRTIGGRRLSQEIYDGNTLVREIWVEYERDVLSAQNQEPSRWYDSNRRVKSRRTVYKDDGELNRQEAHSDFDGLGHYRQTVLTSTVPGGNARTLRTEFNDGNGSYTVNLGSNSVSGNYTVWPTNDPWLISTYTQKSQSENAITARQQFCFNADGEVTRQRTLVGGSPGSQDVLQVFERNGVGNVIRKRIYGGDTGSVGTGAVCSANPGTERYRQEMAYSRGSLSESKWVDANGALTLYTHRSTNDANTGLPATVTANNGLVTTLSYDTSGRLTEEVPEQGEGASTDYTYTPAGTNSLAEVLIRTYSNDGSTILLTRSEVEFDDFGRPWRDVRREPSGQDSTVVTSTNAMGWKASVTERQFGTPSTQTTFKEFDPFGRPRRIIPPDGALHQIVLFYAGDREVRRLFTVCAAATGCLDDGSGPAPGNLTLANDTLNVTESYEVLGRIDVGPSYTVGSQGDLSLISAEIVSFGAGVSVASGGRLAVGVDPDLGTNATGETTFTHIEISDKHGRLYQVKEPSAPDGSDVTTTYTYDIGNRLAKAETSEGGATQTRQFNYDRRGFLLSEKHPEKGSSGNGSVTYSSYDPLGNPGRKVDGPFDLRYGYDRAGRLTSIHESTGGVLQPMKAFIYATSNSGDNLRAGQLETTRRWNYVTLAGQPYTARVDETYRYEGRGGAVSHRDTQLHINGEPRESFAQGFGWHHLGNVNYLDYPRCLHSWCSAPNHIRIRYAYNANNRTYLERVEESATGPNELVGELVQSFVTDHSYHANGLPATVTHANGVTDNQSLNSGMARPQRLWTTGADSNWSSGDYTYDGAGNISAIGSQRFSYDGVSRLTRGQIGTAQVDGGTGFTRTYTYDAFGNLKTKGGLTLPVNSSTNRLTTATTYDAAGNVTNYHGTAFEYDALGMVKQRYDGSETWTFVYTADDERLWTYNSVRPSRWTIRDLDGQVLRDYRQPQTGAWSVERDYIRGNGRLLAAVVPGGGTHHFHPDHLGTPRLITNGNGNKEAYHAYYPYGEEVTFWNQDSERMKFTGHERDFYDGAGAGDDLDYQHARFFQFSSGRYLTPDMGGTTPARPQMWNRYASTLGNPLKWSDPTGDTISLAKLTKEEQNSLLDDLNDFTGNTYDVNEDQELVLIEVGANSSGIATDFFNDLMSEEAGEFTVEATSGGNKADPDNKEVYMNFSSFEGADYGKVRKSTFNLGSTLAHELFHASTGQQDLAPDGTLRVNDYTWTGPVVDFVNSIRSQRGLPTRASYMHNVGLKGRSQFRFKNVNLKKPDKIYVVKRRRPGR